MLRLSVGAECRHRRRVLAIVAAQLADELMRGDRDGEIVLPCDALDERIAEILVPVYVRLANLGARSVEVGIDPGARCGVAFATDEEVVGVFTVPLELLPRILSVLARYFKVRVYLGNMVPEEALPPNAVEVILVDEGRLPLVKYAEPRLSKHARDALRILVKGRLQVAGTVLERVSRQGSRAASSRAPA